MSITILIYKTKNGKEPFNQWLYSLDSSIKARILLRLIRIKEGVFGNYKNLGDGIFEFKLDFGAGYRIYFAQEVTSNILLLLGGDKKTQSSDIRKAKKYLEECNEKTT